MPDENTQPAPEPVQTESTPTQPETPISEPNPVKLDSLATGQDPASVSSQGPIEPAPVQPASSDTSEMPPGPVEAPSSPEEATPVKDANSANEPFLVKDEVPSSHGVSEPAPAPEPLEKPGITIERHGTDTTITEVMQPKSETAQLPPNEPIDLAEEIKTKQRTENLKLANETRQEKKREKIEKILEMFSEQKEITNDEVEKLLHVSDATATRYLEQLEKENKIRQVGKTGKGVKYERI